MSSRRGDRFDEDRQSSAASDDAVCATVLAAQLRDSPRMAPEEPDRPPPLRGCEGGTSSVPLYFLLEMTAVAITSESATSAPSAPSQLTPTVLRT